MSPARLVVRSIVLNYSLYFLETYISRSQSASEHAAGITFQAGGECNLALPHALCLLLICVCAVLRAVFGLALASAIRGRERVR